MHRSMFGVLLCCSFMLLAVAEQSRKCGKCSYDGDEEEQFQSYRDKIQAMEPIPYKGVNTCEACNYTGVYDFIKVEGEKSCAFKTKTGAIIRQATFEFRNLSWTCDCKISDNMLKNLAKLESIVSNNITKECFAGVAQNYATIPLLPSKMTKSDVKDLQTCLPTFVKLFMQLFSLRTFKIGGYWQNLRLYIEFHTDPTGKKTHISNLKILNKDNKGLLPRCEGPEVLTEACRCLLETRYIGYMYVASGRATSTPCYVKMISELYPELFDLMPECKIK